MVDRSRSLRGGRYAPNPGGSTLFTPEQHQFLQGELRRISGAIQGLDEGFFPRWIPFFRLPLTVAAQGSAGKPDFDSTNLGLLFPPNDNTETAYSSGVVPWGYFPGADIQFALLWDQSQASAATWKINYKWYNQGDAVPAAYTTITASLEEFTYSSGTLAQRSLFPVIAGSGKEATSILLVKLYRDDNVVTGDVLGKLLLGLCKVVSPGLKNQFSGE